MKKHRSFDAVIPSKETGWHHIFPISRFPFLKDSKTNKVRVPNNYHSYYHALFTNRSPYEILAFLVNVFWGGKIGYVKDFLRQYEQQKERSLL